MAPQVRNILNINYQWLIYVIYYNYVTIIIFSTLLIIIQLIFGPPGSGKSTSAQMLGRKHEYVFYEGDCIMQSLNPFIDLNVDEPTMVQNEQIPIKVILQNTIGFSMFA